MTARPDAAAPPAGSMAAEHMPAGSMMAARFADLGVLVGLASEAAIIRKNWPGAVIAVTGADAARARQAAADLVADLPLVVSVGTAGGLRPGQAPGDLILASEVQAPDGRCLPTDPALTQAMLAVLAGAGHAPVAGCDVAVTQPAAKAALAEAGAAAVDMESHHLAMAAMAAGRPFAVLRAVLDGPALAIPAFAATAIDTHGRPRLAPVLAGLLRQPGTLPALLALGQGSKAAHAALDRAAARLAATPAWPPV